MAFRIVLKRNLFLLLLDTAGLFVVGRCQFTKRKNACSHGLRDLRCKVPR